MTPFATSIPATTLATETSGSAVAGPEAQKPVPLAPVTVKLAVMAAASASAGTDPTAMVVIAPAVRREGLPG